MNPLILAIDTTHECGSLALACGEAILEEVILHAPEGFAHVIYPELEWLLKKHSIKTDEISCFAAATGPGSFTGVRVGLACVKGLAEACSKPAIGVSNLGALASLGSAELRAPVLDARRGEIYGALYDSEGRIVQDETVAPFASWLATLPLRPLEFVCPDDELVRAGLAGTQFENAHIFAPPRVLAGAVARIAHRRLIRSEALDPAAIDANYVRRSDAELFWKE